jgi:hypothetical protein
MSTDKHDITKKESTPATKSSGIGIGKTKLFLSACKMKQITHLHDANRMSLNTSLQMMLHIPPSAPEGALSPAATSAATMPC